MSALSTPARLRFLEEFAYLPRVTVRDGRAIEQALAGPDLLQPGVQLTGAIVEASLAHRDAGLLKRLHESGVQYVVDPQALRFADASFQEVELIRGLPYAPRRAIELDWTEDEIRQLVRGAFSFQDAHGASARLSIAPPLHDGEGEEWLALHNRMLDAAIALNGRAGFERKPLLAFLAPGRLALRDREATIARLADLPLDGVYVQPLRLSPTKDGVEKLVLYTRLLQRLDALGLPAIAGRVGAFGLGLLALGARAFDSGLGEAERFSLADAVQQPRVRERGDALGPRGSRRVYLEPLKTTLPSRAAEAILSQSELRSHFTCNLGCCRFRGFDGLVGRARQHYLWVRVGEVASLASAPSQAMRREHVHRSFREARDFAAVVSRVLGEKRLQAPDFEHLERWLAVLSRSTDVLDAVA
jgi:hypothetical protein